ncbi:uncharacterized protein V6R79_019394 [Siganus canaliculatus]
MDPRGLALFLDLFLVLVLVLVLALRSSGLGAEDGPEASDDVRLVGGASRCQGALQVKEQGEDWKEVQDGHVDWTAWRAAAVCRRLGCGTVASVTARVHGIASGPYGRQLFSSLTINCSDSYRLENGTTVCSGRLVVRPRTGSSDQVWTPVSPQLFNRWDAEDICSDLGCGAPLRFGGWRYGAGSGASADAVGLVCGDSDEVRLVGGASRCAGSLQLRHEGEWRLLNFLHSSWNLKAASGICHRLKCGSALNVGITSTGSGRATWWVRESCLRSRSLLKECVLTTEEHGYSSVELTCSDSVRLLGRLCSGRLEVNAGEDQRWDSVCVDDFDLRAAAVVCRELGCGAPRLLQGELHGEEEAPWARRFQCDGREAALLSCTTPGAAHCSCAAGGVALTCTGSIRLVGEPSRCAGTLEMKHQNQWRPVGAMDQDWNQTHAAAVCRMLDCGAAVSTEKKPAADFTLVWWVDASCVGSASVLRECLQPQVAASSVNRLQLVCSDLLPPPGVSVSSSADGVSRSEQQGLQVLTGSDFTVTCSVEPWYDGGSFQLHVQASGATQRYACPAVNHSAHFLFLAADHTHRGVYRCVYDLHVFSHNFSSLSLPLTLQVAAPLTELLVRMLVLLLGVALLIGAACFHSKRPGG